MYSVRNPDNQCLAPSKYNNKVTSTSLDLKKTCCLYSAWFCLICFALLIEIKLGEKKQLYGMY